MSTEQTIDALASEEGISESREEIEELVAEKENEFQKKSSTNETDEQIRRIAVMMVKNEFQNLSSSGYIGELEEVPVIPLGYQKQDIGIGIVQDYESLHVGCVVSPPERSAGLAMLVVEGNHVDLDHAKSVLQPLNTVKARIGVEKVGGDSEPTIKKAGNPTYNLRTGEDSIIDKVDTDSLDPNDPLAELPAEKEEKRALVNGNFFPESEVVTVRDFVEHESVQNENGYPAGLGTDMKRLRGQVVDSVKFDYGGGLMTIMDDSVYNEEEIPEELLTEDTRTPGALVRADNDFILGDDSIVDIYGPISQNPNTKQYTINGYGVIPIMNNEYDGGIIETSGGSSSNVEEDKI